MSILDRLLGRKSNNGEDCCDMRIEEIDADETDENPASETPDHTED